MKFTLLIEGNMENVRGGDNVVRAGSTPKYLYINHGKEDLIFNISNSPRLKVKGDDPILYGHALEFLKKNKLEEKFFNLYKEAYDTQFHLLDAGIDKRKILKYMLGKALEDLDINDIEDFLVKHKDYDNFIGSGIKESIPENYLSDGEGSRGRTYTHKDYIGLVAELIQQQLLAPIYLDFVLSINKNSGGLSRGNTLEVLAVLKELRIYTTVAPVRRLLVFVNEHIQVISNGNRDKIINISSFYKVTEEELSEYILAIVLFKILPTHQPICKVPGREEFKNIVAAVYGIITNKLLDSAEKTPNKINPEEAYNGEGKESIYESNKVSTNMSQADEAIILHSTTANNKKELERMLVIIFKEYNKIPVIEDFTLLHRHRKKVKNVYLRLEHMWLLAMFTCTILPSKHLDILPPENIYNLLSICYVLTNKLLGEEHAAIYSMRLDMLEGVIKAVANERISKEQQDVLGKHYPLLRVEKEVEKLIVVRWTSKLFSMLNELQLTNFLDNTQVKNVRGLIVDIMIVSVKDRRI